jgi:hypothetical protein
MLENHIRKRSLQSKVDIRERKRERWVNQINGSVQPLSRALREEAIRWDPKQRVENLKVHE